MSDERTEEEKEYYTPKRCRKLLDAIYELRYQLNYGIDMGEMDDYYMEFDFVLKPLEELEDRVKENWATAKKVV